MSILNNHSRLNRLKSREGLYIENSAITGYTKDIQIKKIIKLFILEELSKYSQTDFIKGWLGNLSAAPTPDPEDINTYPKILNYMLRYCAVDYLDQQRIEFSYNEFYNKKIKPHKM